MLTDTCIIYNYRYINEGPAKATLKAHAWKKKLNTQIFTKTSISVI